MIRSLTLIALVTVLSALAACTASSYWAEWDAPSAGQPVLQTAAGAAATHVVASGETAYSIARRYGVPVARLAQANDLGESFAIREGQALTIPGQAVAAAIPGPAPKPLLIAKRENGAPREGLIWPVTGPVVSGFGAKDDGRINEGVNIAAEIGTPVWAAGDGVVTYVGNEIRGYGNLILIRHPGGLVTAYAHNGKLKVKKGQSVHQGEVIALSGATGTVSTPQLHFEVRHKGHPLDPVSILGAASQVAAR